MVAAMPATGTKLAPRQGKYENQSYRGHAPGHDRCQKTKIHCLRFHTGNRIRRPIASWNQALVAATEHRLNVGEEPTVVEQESPAGESGRCASVDVSDPSPAIFAATGARFGLPYPVA